MEFNKYQSLKQPTDQQTHLLSLMNVVGKLTHNNDIDTLTVLLGDALEHITSIATLNNITLDTVAGINANSYQPNLHKMINKGDTIIYQKDKYIVHDVIGNQLLVANQTRDMVIDINDVSLCQ
ncbi:hypothetical protein [Staphylococcus schleiferi]|uniref:Hypothetical phage-related protein n=1 Tax=Staphylococcus schleiferi TaxID=1295 RepID=A0A7Z7QQB4_STASC|nr:hypothetical protein [Staphylococcus schleiferi]QGS45325.1 hypothetical protein FOB90_00815 [Mammaliicoccus fleurettii]NHA34038.1 hypothetical protein [Staphylococcus schleiferi]NHA38639.1 hypothetical protein [Staphylococcus schleiferi]NHA40802.1 hypothetical protein [Staphylococcus schleiferi]RTX81060.1 hypothetical protein CD142_04500 [Staphylococcus schleiferi subsp. schleiferi]